MGTASGIGIGPKTFFSVFSVDSNTNYWQNVYSTRATGAYDPNTHSDIYLGGPEITTDNLILATSDLSLEAIPNTKVVFDALRLVTHVDTIATNNYPLFLGGAIGIYIPFDGHIAEIIVFNRLLNEEEKGNVQYYLKNKYNIQADN
jgi:hypothetical protein